MTPESTNRTIDIEVAGPPLRSPPFVFGGYSYELRLATEGRLVAKKEYRALSKEYRRGFSTYVIRPKEKLRLLFPIPWPETAEVPVGECQVKVGINSPDSPSVEIGRFTFTVKVRPPTETETAYLAKLESAKGTQSPWVSVGRENASEQIPETLRMNTGLGFELFLSALTAQTNAVSSLSESDLPKDLPAMFSPELDAMRYEILRAKGQRSEADQVRSNLLSACPGIRFLLDEADKGQGILTRLLYGRKAPQ
jgi:hypothetical protein